MRNFITYLLIFTVLISCEKLEEVNPNTSTSELQGTWELNKALCFCFYGDDFNFGAHKLTFNTSATEVNIENSSETFFLSGAGTYPIVTEADRITIKDSIGYLYSIKSDTLTLTYVDDPELADDELTLIYSKN